MAKPTGRGVNPVRFLGFWPKPGYPGSLFWETRTGILVKPRSQLPAVPVLPGPVTGLKKKKKKNFLGLYIGSF
jgi:hypothetical protein